jgi:uncharacterized membrane protein
MENRLYYNEELAWTRYACLILGIWLTLTPWTFTYHSELMARNDVITGLLVIVFSLCAFKLRWKWAPWVVALLGIWLELAPLFFWAPDSFNYLNDTMVGALLITFSILVPGTPGEIVRSGAEKPPGWSYNPSSWQQRIPIIFFGFVGWFLARYMAAYQLGYSTSIYDPVFGDGTLLVITSALSKSFPISDAGLGAVAYTLEALMGAKGGTRRWYTMPWIVVLFGILVVPLGFVSICLVILQPVAVGHWCFWCLLAAICMLTMIALTVDEVVAVCQFLAHVKRQKLPFWKIFWKGGDEIPGTPDTLPPVDGSFARNFPEMVRGFNVPWNLFLSVLLGLWVMFSTQLVFHMTGDAANNNYIFGALTVAISVISMAEVARTLRFINILFGIWLAIHPWIMAGGTAHSAWNGLICGIVLILLNLRRGRIRYTYGRWDKCIV